MITWKKEKSKKGENINTLFLQELFYKNHNFFFFNKVEVIDYDLLCICINL